MNVTWSSSCRVRQTLRKKMDKSPEVRKKAEVSEEGAPGKERKPSFPASSYGGSTGQEHTCVPFRWREACICRGIYKPFISSLSFSSTVKGDENAYFTYSSNKQKGSSLHLAHSRY